MGVSTRTASRSPEISVDEIGGHGRAVSPGGTSGAIAGMLGARNTSHVRDTFLLARPELAVLLPDCPYIERASPSRIDQVEAVTRPIPRASDRNSRLEGIMAFSDRMSLLLLIRPGLSRRRRTVRYPSRNWSHPTRETAPPSPLPRV